MLAHRIEATVGENRTVTLENLPFHSDEEVEIKSEYSKRGWTMQEYHLSSRKLIFYGEMVHWECSGAIWHEDRHFPDDIDQSIAWTRNSVPIFSGLIRGTPCMDLYQILMNDYIKRRLTFESDIFPAISGILSYLSNTFAQGFLFGLPELYFEIGISWMANMHMAEKYSSQAATLIPSWTWFRSHGGKISFPSSTLIVPITQWYVLTISTHDCCKTK